MTGAQSPTPLDLQIDTLADYFVVTATGVFVRQEYLRIVDVIRNKSIETGLGAALGDARKVEGNPTAADRFHIGTYAASQWAGLVRVAMVCRPEVIDRFGETIALNRGATMCVTDDYGHAVDWLMV